MMTWPAQRSARSGSSAGIVKRSACRSTIPNLPTVLQAAGWSMRWPWRRRDNADGRASTSEIDLLTIRFSPDYSASSPLELRLFLEVQTAEKRHVSFEAALLCL